MPRGSLAGMSWWRDLLGLSKRAVSVPQGMALNDGLAMASSSFRAPPRRGTRELIAAYRESPWLRAVAGRIARGVASVEWEVYVRAEEPLAQKTGRRERSSPSGRFSDVAGVPAFRWGRDFAVRDVKLQTGSTQQRAARRRELAAAGLLREVVDHPLLELLANPNTEITGRSSLQMTQTWIDLKGEAFWLIGMKDGIPNSYLALPPHWVTAVPSSTQPSFRLSFGTLQADVPRERMVWLRDPDPENPYGRGTGVAEALGDELETDEFAAKYVKNWFFNNGMPSAVVSYEGIDKEGLKRAEERWGQMHSGYMNAHRVHFSAGKMNAVKLDASFREQQIGELRKAQRDTVAQVFGVPPEIIGIIENSNRSTIDAAAYIYALGVEFPRVEFLRTELQAKLVPMFDEALCLEAEVEVPDDENRRLTVLRTMPGAISLNEWREEAGYEPIPEFDGVFPPLAMPGQQPAGGEQGSSPTPSPSPAAEPAAEDEPAEGESETELELAADPPWARDGARVLSRGTT
jgi:HK97 family phage portal protein